MSASRVSRGAMRAGERIIDLEVRRWRRLEEGLLEKLMTFSRDAASEGTSAHAFEQFWGECSLSTLFDDEASFARFLDWFIFDYRRSKQSRRLIERFRDEAWDDLGEEERSLLAGWLESRLGLFEVVRVEPGRHVILADIFTGERVEVAEKTASHALHKYDLIFTRPLRVFNSYGVSVAGLVVPRAWKRTIEAMLRYELTRFRRWYPAAGWEEFFRERAYRVNRLLVGMILDRAKPHLRTASGERYLVSRAWYQVPDAAPVWEGLSRASGCAVEIAERDEAGRLVRAVWTWSGRWRGTGEDSAIPLGEIKLERGLLCLECLSRERLAMGKRFLSRRLGGVLRHRVDEFVSQRSPVLRPRLDTDGEGPISPEVRQAVQRFLNNYYRRWVDEPLPVLGGDTPREACRTGEGRSQVIEILKLIENMEEKKRRAGQPYIEVSLIRRELGLPEED